MEKLLTVSVASYNVEQFLRKTLDSCIVPELMDALEVLIVNDGSKDSTPQIAAEYQERFPQTFRLIDKENGGYGSTVNRSMQEARGKYFRLLDGDDWFDQDGLKAVMRTLAEAEEDLVVTSIYKVKDGTDDCVKDPDKWAVYHGQTVKIDEIKTDLDVGMWHMIVKRELLRKDPFTLPEHTLYTDMLFVVQSLLRAETIRFVPDALYCYRIGRDGQSVSKESRIKNYRQMLKVFRASVDASAERWGGFSPEKKEVLGTRLRWYHYFALRTMLLPEKSADFKKELVDIDRYVKDRLPDVYVMTGKHSKKVSLLRRTGYAAYGMLAGKEENWT